MKRATDKEIERRKEMARRKGETFAALFMAAIPVIGAFMILGQGGRLAMVAAEPAKIRWTYRGLFLLLLTLPVLCLFLAMHLVQRFYWPDDVAVFMGWVAYGAGVVFAALTHVGIARALGGVPQD